MTTLQDLIDDVRLRTSRETDTSITDDELTGYCNASLAELDDLLISTYEDYKLTEFAATITSAVDGSNSFDLPADFYKARGLDRSYGGLYSRIDPYSFNQRTDFNFPWRSFPYVAVRYRVEGTVCKVTPFTSAPGVYRFWYIPKFTPLALTDSLPAYMDTNAWCEYAIVDTCVKVQAKQQEDVSIFAGQKQELRLRILNVAKQRDAGGLSRRIDVYECRCRAFPCRCSFGL